MVQDPKQQQQPEPSKQQPIPKSEWEAELSDEQLDQAAGGAVFEPASDL